MNLETIIKVSVDRNLPLLLVGKHGTGKSYSVMQEAKKNGKTLHRIIITQETTPEDLVFQYELKDGQTVLIKHDLLKAAEKGHWICFEEINMGSPAVLTLLNGLLETDIDSRYIRFQDEEVKPHKDFRMFATSNPTSYSGANRMNDALLSRFLVGLVQPDYVRFLNIIKAQVKDNVYEDSKKFLSAITKVGKNYELYISPRELLVYAQLRESGMTHEDSINVILGRHYDLDQDQLEDVAALFDTELKREKIHVLNEVELKKVVEKETAELRIKNNELERESKELKKWKAVYDDAKAVFSK